MNLIVSLGCILVLARISSVCAAEHRTPGSELFSDPAIRQFKIDIGESEVQKLRRDHKTYVRGTVTAGQQIFKTCGIRLKGEGSFRPIDIRLPERSWLNAKWPSPTIGCTTLTSSKITAAIWKALSDAIPDRAVAPTGGTCARFRDLYGVPRGCGLSCSPSCSSAGPRSTGSFPRRISGRVRL